ncbi:unnamed protein product, partial [Ectocarpus sp. 4 AP-2014]
NFKATPLILAALGGHEHVVRCLLYAVAGAPNRYNCEEGRCHAELRSTTLYYAAKGCHVGVIAALLSAGFCNGQHDKAGVTAAKISARVGHTSSREATRRVLGGDGGGKLVYDYFNMVSQDVATVYGLVPRRGVPGLAGQPQETLSVAPGGVLWALPDSRDPSRCWRQPKRRRQPRRYPVAYGCRQGMRG